MSRRVRFKNCPVGLFWCGDTLAVMTEYVTTIEANATRERRYNRDAYIVESGEYFAGGTISYEARDELMVTPVRYEDAAKKLSVPTPRRAAQTGE